MDTSVKGQHAGRLRHAEMSLKALYHVIYNNPGVEMQCIGHFKLLFSLLKVQGASMVQNLALKVRNLVLSHMSWFYSCFPGPVLHVV